MVIHSYHKGATMSPTDEEHISELHESFCEMTNVGQIVSCLYSRRVISTRKRLQQLNRYLKDEGSFTAASKGLMFS